MLLNATLHFKNKHYKKIGGHASFCAVLSVQICSFLCLFFVPDLCLLSSQPYHSCITQSWSGCMEEEEEGREKQRVTVYFPIPGRGEKKSACLARLCAPALLQQRENIIPYTSAHLNAPFIITERRNASRLLLQSPGRYSSLPKQSGTSLTCRGLASPPWIQDLFCGHMAHRAGTG